VRHLFRTSTPILSIFCAAGVAASCGSNTQTTFGQGPLGGSSSSSGGGNSSSSAGDNGSSGGNGSSGSTSGTNGNGSSGTDTSSSGSYASSTSSSSGSGHASGSSGSSTHDGGSTSGGTTGPITTSGAGPKIPAVMGTCPTLATGTITVSGQSVSIWAGAKSATPAPILFYWHGTGSSAAEAQYEMGTEINEITAAGGLVASFSTSTAQGTDTGDAVWYTGDFAMADQILACAVQQLNIDTRKIYTAGCSAGGLQAGAMVYSRASYLAAAMPNSGGIVFAFPTDDASHIPSVITTHGGSSDMVVVSFSMTSMTLDNDIAMKGGYVIDCNHGGGHCGAPANDIAAQWQFCKDHPYGVSPNPYASGLPSSFPTYCTIIH
jgi:hypothetical protein